MEKEVWKPYPEYPFIQGSSLGRVRTVDRYVKNKNGKRIVKGHVLKQYRMRNGYLFVPLKVNGKTVNLSAHRVIASCFLPNTLGLPEVNHINGDRTDNRLDNLEWCTREYNVQYKEKYGVSTAETKSLPVYAINVGTLEVFRFKSRLEADRALGINQSSIVKVIKGKQKTAVGYWFTNADENAVESTRAKFGDVVADKVEQLMSERELQPA